MGDTNTIKITINNNTIPRSYDNGSKEYHISMKVNQNINSKYDNHLFNIQSTTPGEFISCISYGKTAWFAYVWLLYIQAAAMDHQGCGLDEYTAINRYL